MHEQPAAALRTTLDCIAATWGPALDAGITALAVGDVEHVNLVWERFDAMYRELCAVAAPDGVTLEVEEMVHGLLDSALPMLEQFLDDGSIANGWSDPTY